MSALRPVIFLFVFRAFQAFIFKNNTIVVKQNYLKNFLCHQLADLRFGYFRFVF